MLSSFHFLRPWWFIAIIPMLILFIFMLRRSSLAKSNWEQHCDPHLLTQLLVKNLGSTKTVLPYYLLVLWILLIAALAGPTWSLYAEPVYQKNIGRVIALDVSPSMNANDISPSRIQRAKFKVLDLLHDIKEGQTGMIVFSSAAFVVSPLTTDTNTIANMVPVLDPSIVPVAGSDIDSALQKAVALLNQAGYLEGQIIIVTDSTPSSLALRDASKLAKQGYHVSVLAIGTKDGGPILKPNGGFETDDKGNIIFAHLDSSALEKLASNGSGVYAPFSNDSSDLKEILNEGNPNDLSNKPSKEMQTQNLWRDEGHWLIWLAIILAVFIARRGWLEKIC